MQIKDLLNMLTNNKQENETKLAALQERYESICKSIATTLDQKVEAMHLIGSISTLRILNARNIKFNDHHS